MNQKWHKWIVTSVVLLICIFLNINTFAYGEKNRNSSANNDNTNVIVESGITNKEDETSKKKESDSQHNSRGKEQTTDSKQVYLVLAAIFGVGSFSAVILYTINKWLIGRKVTALPVLYYGRNEENMNG
ncbi:Hypothetical protein CM240_3183 [Clostridium bornimense]|uniref:Uncharacterized protein n=1 Tax=Clostridium bornimense TaxID=1216932 RepID=W6SKC7_9CLOT|nr:hypothetical protein [Clostridium bornimense]CDM70300.1 Hypothetical protein CM240_3183 [Clostridium bornimense]